MSLSSPRTVRGSPQSHHAFPSSWIPILALLDPIMAFPHPDLVIISSDAPVTSETLHISSPMVSGYTPISGLHAHTSPYCGSIVQLVCHWSLVVITQSRTFLKVERIPDIINSHNPGPASKSRYFPTPSLAYHLQVLPLHASW